MPSRYTLLSDPLQSHTTPLTKNLNAFVAWLRSLLASARSRPLSAVGCTLGALAFLHYVSLLTGLPTRAPVSVTTDPEGGLAVDGLGESFGESFSIGHRVHAILRGKTQTAMYQEVKSFPGLLRRSPAVH
jgi:hypothetical protein